MLGSASNEPALLDSLAFQHQLTDRQWPSGEYVIRYSDNTHMGAGTWKSLAKLTLGELRSQPSITTDDEIPFYEIQPSLIDHDAPDQAIVATILSQSLCRLGLVMPSMSVADMECIIDLNLRDAVILIPDTNVLCNGSMSWLAKVVNKAQVWILPIVVSLTQVQQRDAILKGLVRKGNKHKLRDALRSRNLVNSSLSLLEKLRERYDIMEVSPELLRYVKLSGRSSADPDEGDVLEDRLLIEAIHEVFKGSRSRTEKRVVTSDILLGRVLHAEGIPALILTSPALPSTPVSCVRYDAVAKSFLGASLTHLLWDFCHTFSSIRVERGEKDVALQLDAYWAGKNTDDWLRERLSVNLAERRPTTRRKEADGAMPGGKLEYSSALLPEASFLQVLRLGGLLLRENSAANELVPRAIRELAISEEVARMAAEILLRAGFVYASDDEIAPTDKLHRLEHALEQGALDEASNLWTGYPPFKALIQLLRQHRELQSTDLPDFLAPALGGKPGKEACARFARVPVYLAQAWTDQTVVRDGTHRPDDSEFSAAWLETFGALEQDGICRIRDLLPAFCRATSMSPWAASRQLATVVQEGGLQDLSFQSAAGKRPVGRDHVVEGSLQGVHVSIVPLDRVDIGGRPVFTVSRR